MLQSDFNYMLHEILDIEGHRIYQLGSLVDSAGSGQIQMNWLHYLARGFYALNQIFHAKYIENFMAYSLILQGSS